MWGYLIALWGDDECVSYLSFHEEYGYIDWQNDYCTIGGAQRYFLVDGRRTEILEYNPRCDQEQDVCEGIANKRCNYWGEQLKLLEKLNDG